MEKKRTKKALIALMCACLLVAGSVSATMAWLSSTTDTVTNTFTAGKVAITLDESDVNEYGVVDGTDRVKTNADYILIPGHEYIKDPIVHFADKSEASWLFVKVEISNDIAAIECSEDGDSTGTYKPIAMQISNNGWSALPGETDAYYKEVLKNTTGSAADYPVFGTFVVDPDADAGKIDACNGDTIKVTAYAVQKDGVADAATAWGIITTP